MFSFLSMGGPTVFSVLFDLLIVVGIVVFILAIFGGKRRYRKYINRAKRGDAFAQCQIGAYYIFKKHFFRFWKDMYKAEYWFTQAANNGNRDAMKYLADGYSDEFNSSGTSFYRFGYNYEKEKYWRQRMH